MTGNNESVDVVRRTLASELAAVLGPLTDAMEEGPGAIFRLLEQAGVEEDLDVAALEEVTGILTDELGQPLLDLVGLARTVGAGEASAADVVDLVEHVVTIVEGVQALDDVSVGEPNVDGFGHRLLEYLLARYLYTHHRDVYYFAVVSGVVEERDEPPYRTLDLSRVPALLEDPNDLLIDALDLEGEDDTYVAIARLTTFVAEASSRRLLPAPTSRTDPNDVKRLLKMGADEEITSLPAIDGPEELLPQSTVDVAVVPFGDGACVVGFRVIPLPETASQPAGIGILPVIQGTLSTDERTTLGEDEAWTASFSLSGEASLDTYGVVIRPTDEGVETRLLEVSADGTPVDTSLHAEAALEYDATDDDEYRMLVGDEEGANIGIGPITARTQLSHDDDGTAFALEAPLFGRISVTASDGFLASVLPEDGITYDFAVTLGWSSTSGLYFESGGTLEVAIPQNAQLGPVAIEEIYVGALPGGVDDEDEDDPSVTLTANASASVELGPVVGTVQRMGIRANIAFPEDGDGSLGPIDLDVGFDPPNGIGLAIDAEGISGGGFLELDYENERYAGAVQLHVGELTFNAVGLLTTRMPDGSDGFSLLILITAEFPPIELGLGFTLNGLGGLVGIHRGVKTDPLKRAVRDGTLDSVLFPEDVVENAPRIVSDLRETFPPTADYHVFGPMARLGWGTPTLITADLGVLVEIPSIRIVLLGRISAVLPDEAAPLVELNAGVFGIIDPAVPELELHASLYDSRVVAWDLSGDFGLRIRGGDQPDFLLSAGGFHPQYDPPASFADMRRLRASLGPPGGNPSLVLKGYFAVTSNTVQAGANCSFAGEFGPASVDGELGFDALVQFDPFEFIVDVIASLSVRALKTTFSVSLEGSLSGPSPWHIDGKVKVSIAFVSATVRVDATFGSANQRDALPPVDVLSKLAAAIEQPGNWQTGLPGDGESPVTLRDPSDVDVEYNGEDETPTILVHPLAAPSVRQTVVPLDFEIERFGNAEPADATRFEIAGASVEGEEENAEPMLDVGKPVTEKFAPGEYLDLSDDERLDSPAFESMQAGTRFESGGVYAGQETADDGPNLANNARRTVLAYETTVRDEACDKYGVALDSFDAVEVVPTSLGSEITRQLTRATIDRQTIGCESGPAPKETVDEGTTPSEATLEGSFTGGTSDRRYRIVRTDTFEPVDLDGHDDGGYTKAEAKRTIERYAPDGATSRYQVVAGDQLE